ncbi:MAG: hypothetical protein CO029_03475 [Candidatus Magasanikbacteria bacterium CG_4_9_14_0_2_um_filter_41_10]|uniref:Uncharacterized protein n=1 Tax=Candidatus Magasanikbacteria bacterium CG_4_10_14_0_2_um_filter_41_31 TaxID=1974639 RepID=A0A2M7V5I9_9BACT|nr:MAG: hypothetical protein COX83_00830 [Candidatus Magasanikbacteria bacterium CG_4_10_14_0_2_um_filter_41_31]PJC53294.1 MAG: hypothetical protein CO029_03475 [Candidatus Magasanikbacteria bacterium CG_4_9_14_0_2_um_filter_41_10]
MSQPIDGLLSDVKNAFRYDSELHSLLRQPELDRSALVKALQERMATILAVRNEPFVNQDMYALRVKVVEALLDRARVMLGNLDVMSFS